MWSALPPTLLLEVDEAQDVDEEKFAKEFLPMAAAQNATIVLYGTPWTKDTLLAKYKALNLAHAERTGEQRHFSFPVAGRGAGKPALRSGGEGADSPARRG